jgi:DNA primase
VVPEVSVCRPPEGKDPDLWVREAGAAEVAEALEQAPGALAFLERLMVDGRLARRDAARRAAELAAVIPDPLDRDLWSQEGASRFGISAEAFAQAVRKLAGGRISPSSPPPAASEAPGSGTRTVWAGLERECVRAALAWPERAGELAAAFEEAPGLAPEIAPLLRAIVAESAGGGDPAAVLSRLLRSDPRAAQLSEVAAAEGAAPTPPAVLAAKVRLHGLRAQAEALQASIRRAQESGNREEEDRLLRERLELRALQTRLTRAAEGRAPASGPDAGPSRPPEGSGQT